LFAKISELFYNAAILVRWLFTNIKFNKFIFIVLSATHAISLITFNIHSCKIQLSTTACTLRQVTGGVIIIFGICSLGGG
jgi:hypothetical protein